ncbi:MAG: carbohydrate ABC transporter permease [Chloroflexi bacterium]|nr:carbohydrate ABC transporter permease [Chloroflexota bacterium]
MRQALLSGAPPDMAMRRAGLRLLTHALLLLCCFVILFPVLAMLGIALKDQGVPADVLALFPRQLYFGNFWLVWAETPLGIMLRNSAIVTICTTVLVLGLGSLAAYGFSRWRFLGSRLLLVTLLLGLMLPAAALIIPLFRTVRLLGLFNTYPALILPYTAFGLPFCILVLRSYFDTLPIEIEEAAIIDGASSLSIFYRIALPMSTPAISAVAIFQALGAWNEFLMAMLFMTRTEARTAPLAWIYYINLYVVNYERTFAALTWIVIPAMVVYLVLQRQFVSGLTAGALKG